MNASARMSAAIRLMERYFLNTTFVSAALEIGAEESLRNLERQLLRDKPCRKRKDISIVVLTSQLSEGHIPAEGCSYALMFIGGHADTIARAAKDNAEVGFRILHSCCARMSIIRIIAAL